MAFVYVLSTGGTIGTFVDKSGIARVGNTMQDLISRTSVPGVEIEAKSLMKKGSANMEPSDWITIAKAARQVIKSRSDVSGVVILHGTDTMHYTAAALSFMLQNPGLPVVMTGSMITGSDPQSDAIPNFNAALMVAAKSNIAEITVVLSADSGGERKIVIRGSRARKVRSLSLNALESINVPPLAFVENEKITYTGEKYARKSSEKNLKLDTRLEPNVVYLKQNPALTPKMLSRFLKGAKGAVIEGTGTGHVKENLLDTIASFGAPVVISTQALYGGEKLGTYDIGNNMLKVKNIIPASDMTSEAALVKLMWCLGHSGNVRRKFLQNVAGEITAR